MDRAAFLLLLPKPVPVDLPGGRAFVRAMTVGERADWVSVPEDQESRARAVLLSKCISDESGTRLFTDSVEDVAEIERMPAIVVDALVSAALRINALDAASAGEIPKNSEAGQT